MKSVLGNGIWQKGNPELKEPDYIFNNIPLEFTLASDKCNKNNMLLTSISRKSALKYIYISPSTPRSECKNKNTLNTYIYIRTPPLPNTIKMHLN